MPLEPLTPSIDLPSTSSGGLSATDFMRRFNQQALIDELGAGEVVLTSTVGSAQEGLSFRATMRPFEAKKRLLGIALLSAMPAGGLDEVLVSLMEVFDFHYTNQFLLQEPLITRQSACRVVTRGDRPDLIIEE